MATNEEELRGQPAWILRAPTTIVTGRFESLRFPKSFLQTALVVGFCASTLAQTTSRHFSASAQHFQDKLNFIERNASSNPVQRRSTQINADEVNAWFREGGYKLPQGVEKVVFHSQPDIIIADTTVDFDAVKQGKRNLNPLLSMFSGVHEVQVTASASAQNRQGHVTIQSVSIDDVGVPHLALELFVSKYITPKYPNVGLENQFEMPDRIDSATVGNDNTLLTQK
jgi:hypothetical protein